jgi:ribonuclease D
MKTSEYKVEWIDSSIALEKACQKWHEGTCLTIDTEYDSFKRSYGFKALLIQVFDGITVYIIDPLSVISLQPLWEVIEDENIQKILYSGSEDIALLKAMGCSIRNVFDVQIAATLSNHPARNLGGLIEVETGEALDKSQQQSDWSKRPLSDAQLSYAANDVVFLPGIAQKLTQQVEERGLIHVLHTENKALESIEERSHVPKLKPYHFRLHSDAFCESLLQLLQWRDRTAKAFDVPPVHIVDLIPLEKALQFKSDFLRSGEFLGFHHKIKKNGELREEVEDIVRAYDPNNLERKRERRQRPLSFTKEETEQIIQSKCMPFKQIAVERYGELTGEYLVRGLKKLVTTPEPDLSELKAYQLQLYTCMKEGREWPWS